MWVTYPVFPCQSPAWPEDVWALSCSSLRWPCYFPLPRTTADHQLQSESSYSWLPGATGPLGNHKLCADLRQSLHSLLINFFKNQATVPQSRKPYLEGSHELSPLPPVLPPSAWQTWMRRPQHPSSHPGAVSHLAEAPPLGFSWDHRAGARALSPGPSHWAISSPFKAGPDGWCVGLVNQVPTIYILFRAMEIASTELKPHTVMSGHLQGVIFERRRCGKQDTGFHFEHLCIIHFLTMCINLRFDWLKHKEK